MTRYKRHGTRETRYRRHGTRITRCRQRLDRYVGPRMRGTRYRHPPTRYTGSLTRESVYSCLWSSRTTSNLISGQVHVARVLVRLISGEQVTAQTPTGGSHGYVRLEEHVTSNLRTVEKNDFPNLIFDQVRIVSVDANFDSKESQRRRARIEPVQQTGETVCLDQELTWTEKNNIPSNLRPISSQVHVASIPERLTSNEQVTTQTPAPSSHETVRPNRVDPAVPGNEQP